MTTRLRKLTFSVVAFTCSSLRILVAIASVLITSMAFGQIAPACDVDCNPPTPPNAPPTTGQMPIDRAQPFNQTGFGNIVSAASDTGGSTTVQGSSSFTYAVPMFSVPGAGLDLKLGLYYNSHIWIRDVNGGYMMGFDRNTPAPGFQLNFGFVEWNPSANGPAGVITMPDGAKHAVALNLSNLVYDQTYNTYRCANQICLYDSTDSSYINISRPLGTYNGQVCTGPNNCPSKDITVTFKNGTQSIYQSFAVVTNDLYDEFVMRPYKIEDSNGNILTITYTNPNELSISSITDSVNRVYNFFYTDASSGATCGGGGSCSAGSLLNCVTDGSSCSSINARTFTFSYDPTHSVNFNFSPNSAQVLTAGNLVTVQSGFTMPVLTRVCRPNGTCIRFTYGDWAIVNDVQELSADGSTPRYELSYDFPAANAGALTANPTYTHQTETINGQTNRWTFAHNTNADGVVTSSSITDPTGEISTTTFSNNGDWADGLPTQVQTTDSSGKVWSQRDVVWTSDLAEAQSGITNGGYQTGKNPRPASLTITLDDGSKSQITMSYDNSPTPVAAGAPQPFTGSGSIIDQVETDFGATAPGPVLRETVTQYTSLSNHILGLPKDIKIKDGTGTVFSHTVLGYDELPVQDLSTPPLAHDNLGYSAISTAPRGNLTSRKTYSDPVADTGPVTTTLKYDIRGNKISEVTGSGAPATWSFSANTDYAYPDSVSLGPTGSQLTTNFTYYPNGNLATSTDWNGNKTTYNYDSSGRPTSTQTADGVTRSTSYDDRSSNPSVTQSTSANSLVTTRVQDFHGHPVTDQTLNGTSLISTVGYTTDPKGRVLQVSNPFAPGQSPVYTTYTYDLLGRQTQITPPALDGSVPQKPYKFDITGGTLLATDPAGQQKKQYKNALGQVVREDVPGPSGGAPGSGPVTISGAEQTASVSSGGGATAGTGNVTIGGAENSTQVLTHTATKSAGSVTISGSEQSVTIPGSSFCNFYNDNGDCVDWEFNPPTTITDAGTISITVNGHVDSYSYSSADTTGSVATGLANAINADAAAGVTASASGATVNLISRIAGASANYPLSASYSWDSGDFTSPSFTTGVSGSTLTGGTDNTYRTEYNKGNVTVTITTTVNGVATNASKTYVYGQTDTASTVASGLAALMHGDTTFPVDATSSGTVLNLTTRQTGNGTGYPLAASAVSTDQFFSASAFTATPSGANLTSGQNGVIPDSGTVTVTVKRSTITLASEVVNYGVGSTPATLANGIVLAFNADSNSPVTASSAAGSGTVTLTSKQLGADTNFTISATTATSQGTLFSHPSFTAAASSLTGGADPVFSFNTPITTTYSYDPLGNRLQISQGQQSSTFVYDGLSRMTSSATPETGGQPVAYTYKDFGAISQIIDPRLVAGTSNHVTATYGYDALSRVASISYNDNVTPNVTYSYNPPNSANNTGGRLAGISNSVEGKAYQYDLMGRVTQCTETIGANQYTVGYGYGADGQLTGITYPSQLKVNYSYDPVGRLKTLTATSGTATQNIFSIDPNDYTAAGMTTKITYGNNVIGKFGFNNQLQASSIEYDAPAPAAPLLSLTYNYGGAADNGQIQGITDNLTSSRSTSYQYDPLGRLQMAQTVDQTSASSWKLNYGFDNYGNRLRQTPVAGSSAMPASNTLVDPATNRIQGQGVIYDAVGNMISDGLNNFLFDANSMLVQSNGIPGWGGNPVTFAYGPDGALVNKNGTYYIYANGRPIAEYANGAAAGSPSAQYVNLGLQQIAKLAANTTTFNYLDHLSIRVTADATGNPVSTNGHFPYGESLYHTGPTTEFAFTTYRRDANTGLDYADARFYSSRLGRFLSMDPLLGDNRYAYVNGDPINLVDPSGRDAGSPCSLDPFSNFNLPLCGPDQFGSGVGPGSNCGANFSDGGISITFTSNCSSFQVNFQNPSNPFGQIQNAVDTLLQLFLNPETCPAGTFECPEDGRRLFGDPSCGQFCVMDNGFQGGFRPPCGFECGQPRDDPFKRRLFGTHWCGPGGAGPTLGSLDEACKAHDACYAAGGFTSWSNYNVFMSKTRERALRACNQALCDAAQKAGKEGNLVNAYFSTVFAGECHTYSIPKNYKPVW